MDVTHLIRDIASPTLSELIERTAPAHRSLWADAGRIAAHRIEQERTLLEHLDVLRLPPWNQRTPVAWKLLPKTIVADDLARVIVARYPELLEELELTLEDAPDRWRQIIQDAPPPRETLSYALGRRWAWILERDPALIVDPLVWIRALPERATMGLTDFDALFNEGLITQFEAGRAILNRFKQRHGSTFGRVPPALMARDPTPETIRAALDQHRGVILVGPPGSGKLTAIHRWAEVDAPPYPVRVLDTLSVDPLPDLTINGEERVLSCATHDTWSAIRSIPAVREHYTRLYVQPIPDRELVALWVCQRPLLEDWLGEPLPMLELLMLLRVQPDPRKLLDDLGPDVWLQDTPTWLFGERHVSRWWKRLASTDPAKLLRRMHQRLVKRDQIPNVGYLKALLELDRGLTGAAPTEGESSSLPNLDNR